MSRKLIQQTHNVLRYVVLQTLGVFGLLLMVTSGWWAEDNDVLILVVANAYGLLILLVCIVCVVLRRIGAKRDPYGRWSKVTWEKLK